MSFTLLNELHVIKEAQIFDETYPLMESVGTLLQSLVAKIKNKPDSFLEHIEIPELAAQLAGLMILGKSANRESFDDFAKLDDKQLSQNFYNFLRDIAEPHTEKLFQDGQMTADKFLNYIGTTHAKSLVEDWTKILENAKAQDEEALKKVSKAFDTLNNHYANVFKTLSDQFMNKQLDKVTSSFDNALTDLSAT